ncbi:serine/threonine protein kinase [Domibacillus iocasae]|uniref:Serine/threonine protein kinase n=1 Tax=Domibacillus iocasae TaxID=1714016 RepID=A0A1E7DPL3_9BACI|nr:serine/threonine protein kinase [Domibacillus iocasae]OES45022.1 serine/threonine protein kinase [Domibacillus iocasae]
MKRYKHLAESVRFKRQGGHWRSIASNEKLIFAGEGRSAVVFRIKGTDEALKVFYPDKVHIAKEEADIYRLLSGVPHFPTLHEAGGTYIVIDWVEGKTFFQCLEEGIEISTRHIQEADRGLSAARTRGLNPSDVHLRNIMITTAGSTMIIDVARFRQTKDCMNWEDIKTAHSTFYTKPFFPKRWPKRLLNMLGVLYKKRLLPVHRAAHAKNPQ